MPETAKIREAIEFLYERIEVPLKKYKVARDEALEELDALEAELAGDTKLEDKTVDEVLQLVAEGSVSAQDALNFELAGKRRVTLVEELEDLLAEDE